MRSNNSALTGDFPEAVRNLNACFSSPVSTTDSTPSPTPDANDLLKGSVAGRFHDTLSIRTSLQQQLPLEQDGELQDFSLTLEEFVRRRFVPECVALRRLSGRTHFHFILRHILTPEQVGRTFGIRSEAKNLGVRSITDWPYLGSMPLHHIDQTAIQLLTSTALRVGYSAQTVTHIRNVIRSIFAHAITTKCFVGNNPASLVKFPSIVRKTQHALTISQLRQALMMMGYPEKLIALFSILTDMNLSEICGLQWRYVNFSPHPRLLEPELLPARTIAIRNQSYRGEFRSVADCRSRFVPIPDILLSLLSDLKRRVRFTEPQDFVFASRTGTAISPENLGARRLKAIGRIIDMPWLSWSVFHRTHCALKSQFGQRLNRELEEVLPVGNSTLEINTRHIAQPPLKTPNRQWR
jgi:site-specific recombinase XerC